MESAQAPFDYGVVAKELSLPAASVERTIALLDEGNTVPFITRYRKDQTGGFDEEQIRRVQDLVQRMRMLRERKDTILKSIEGQGKLTPELAAEITAAQSLKRIEDLYLPYKPKKQTLATLARERGLEPLAREIFENDPAAADLEKRAADFVNPDKQLNSIAEVLLGVGHLIAERIGEKAEVRGPLRKILRRTGKLVCSQIEPAAEAPSAVVPPAISAAETAATTSTLEPSVPAAERTDEALAHAADAVTDAPAAEHESTDDEAGDEEHEFDHEEASAENPDEQHEETGVDDTSDESEHQDGETPHPVPAGESASDLAVKAEGSSSESSEPTKSSEAASSTPPAGTSSVAPTAGRNVARVDKKKKKKELAAFKDFFQYQEAISRVPPHRVLAINRGERARVLRVKIDADFATMEREALSFLVDPQHPHRDFLTGCIRDGLNRLVFPSLEREVRRELTEKAEEHAVEVFARNLRKLLLQPPVRGRRVLALDPGYRSGCKIAAVDQFGSVVGHAVIPVVGNDERRKKGRQRLAEMLRKYEIDVVAIGNGTACRETEQIVAQVIAEEFKDRELAYCFVNEAGASVYSTSPIGREELPQHDATVRSAVSIGRRLLDPLSELVKINPANIGVGMYQHDVKGKHLQTSLDAVVESCVNFVGVDVNTASPALLRYVSGLNQLTARKIFEHRQEHGPFRNREQLKEVSGIGHSSFVQAAGFLRIVGGGDNPLDATWIHPESYEIARRVLEKIGSGEAELAAGVHRPAPPPVPETTNIVPGEIAPAVAEVETVSHPSGSASDAEIVSTESVSNAAEVVVAPPVTESAPAAAELASPIQAAESASAVASEAAPAETPAPVVPPPPSPEMLARESLAAKVRAANVDELAAELNVGKLLLQDILTALTSPGRDPREDLAPPVFRREIMKLEDLKSGMELVGTVLNVVDFGAFVDIGLADSGLVHISRLVDRYIKDPHEVVGVGDVLKVWVVEVDLERRRVSLTAIKPGSEKTSAQRAADRAPRPQGQRPPRSRGERGPRPTQEASPSQGGEISASTGAPSSVPPGRPPFERRDRGPSRGSDRGGDRGRGSDRGGDRGRGGPRDRSERPPVRQPKQQPKPVKPLTKAMQDGREPLRSFSDLAQFWVKKPSGESDPPPAPKAAE